MSQNNSPVKNIQAKEAKTVEELYARYFPNAYNEALEEAEFNSKSTLAIPSHASLLSAVFKGA
jgi:hypothetical protein